MRAPFGLVVASLLLVACSSNESARAGSGGAAGNAGSAGDAASEAAAPFSLSVFDKVRIGSDQNGPNFQQAKSSVDWASGPFSKVTLVADLGTTCYPFDNWKNDPPPAGQSWPADCDAFDRNFEFHLDPPSDSAKGPPAVELERAITPFGGPLHLDVDVTDVANGLPGKHEISVVVTTWSDAAGKVSGSNGGWYVTARLDLVPGPAPRKVLAVVPLYDGSETDPTPLAPIPFEVPAGSVSSRLDFRATGHGGVVGASGCGLAPADEFCLRSFTMLADENPFDDLQPWRDDCATLCTLAHQDGPNGGFDYCKENPCGAVDSVKAPRANWCPGSETPPFTWDLPALATPGKHNFRWQISDVAQGASWRISANYFAFGD